MVNLDNLVPGKGFNVDIDCPHFARLILTGRFVNVCGIPPNMNAREVVTLLTGTRTVELIGGGPYKPRSLSRPSDGWTGEDSPP